MPIVSESGTKRSRGLPWLVAGLLASMLFLAAFVLAPILRLNTRVGQVEISAAIDPTVSGASTGRSAATGGSHVAIAGFQAWHLRLGTWRWSLRLNP